MRRLNNTIFYLSCIITFYVVWKAYVNADNEIIQAGGLNAGGIETGFNPVKRFGAGSVRLWLRGDVGITLDTTGTPSISRWDDVLSDSGNYVVQETKTNQPTQTNLFGKTGVYIVGSQFMYSDNTLCPSLTSFLNPGDKPFSIFACWNGQIQNSAGTMLAFGNSTNTVTRFGAKINTGVNNAFNLREDSDSGTSTYFNPAPMLRSSNHWENFCWTSDGTSKEVYTCDRFFTGVGASISPQTFETFSLGSWYRGGSSIFPATGGIMEVLILTNRCSEADVNYVFGYFKQRYNR